MRPSLAKQRSPRVLHLFGCAVALVAAACGGHRDEDARVDVLTTENINPPGITLSLCGVVDAYVPSDGTNDGVLSVDGRTWHIVPAADITSADLLVEGQNICFSADLDTSLRIERATVSAAEE
jgi:hypothetical protein